MTVKGVMIEGRYGFACLQFVCTYKKIYIYIYIYIYIVIAFLNLTTKCDP